jgi:hypothetical protein
MMIMRTKVMMMTKYKPRERKKGIKKRREEEEKARWKKTMDGVLFTKQEFR